MQNSFIKYIKERRETVNWRAQTEHTLPFNCNNVTQDKGKMRKASINEGKVE